MLQTHSSNADERLSQIEWVRRAVLNDGHVPDDNLTQPWITRSWQRCLQNGQLPHQTVVFDQVTAEAKRRSEESNQVLLQAARPALHKLSQAIVDTRYFAILTNAEGMVVDVGGNIDRSDPRANVIARVGVDLSEERVGTTAISAALTELHPVWLHRGEHFYCANASYSCAGAPLFGPTGQCVGMLDVTGIDAQERPELKYLVAQSARSIENALTLERKHSLTIRLNWPGRMLGDETDGLVCMDKDGWITGANQMARQMAAQLIPNMPQNGAPLHASEVFALPFEMLFDAAGRDAYGQPAPMDVPLWSGLRLQALPLRVRSAGTAEITQRVSTGGQQSLRDVETALIRKAVAQAKGNVMQAARALGISRATVYRKLGNKPPN